MAEVQTFSHTTSISSTSHPTKYRIKNVSSGRIYKWAIVSNYIYKVLIYIFLFLFGNIFSTQHKLHVSKQLLNTDNLWCFFFLCFPSIIWFENSLAIPTAKSAHSKHTKCPCVTIATKIFQQAFLGYLFSAHLVSYLGWFYWIQSKIWCA